MLKFNLIILLGLVVICVVDVGGAAEGDGDGNKTPGSPDHDASDGDTPEPAFENWDKAAETLFDHFDQYTGLALKAKLEKCLETNKVYRKDNSENAVHFCVKQNVDIYFEKIRESNFYSDDEIKKEGISAAISDYMYRFLKLKRFAADFTETVTLDSIRYPETTTQVINGPLRVGVQNEENAAAPAP